MLEEYKWPYVISLVLILLLKASGSHALQPSIAHDSYAECS